MSELQTPCNAICPPILFRGCLIHPSAALISPQTHRSRFLHRIDSIYSWLPRCPTFTHRLASLLAGHPVSGVVAEHPPLHPPRPAGPPRLDAPRVTSGLPAPNTAAGGRCRAHLSPPRNHGGSVLSESTMVAAYSVSPPWWQRTQ